MGCPGRIQPPERSRRERARSRRRDCRLMPRAPCAARGRASVDPNRSRSSRCRAPMLSGPTRTAKRRSSGMASSSLPSPASTIAGGREEAPPAPREVAGRQLQHCGRRSIEPLQVVHRKHDRLRCGEDAQHAEQGDPRVCRPGGGPAESRRRSAISSARRWGRGSPGSTSSSTSASRSLTTLYENASSFSAGLARRTQ